jgi:hypothetical protein
MSGEPLRITIPLPPKGCAQNTHGHWIVRHRANATHREEALLAARQVYLWKTRFAFERATITPTFYCAPSKADGGDGRYRPLDSTNAAASLKAAVDGLVDGGIFPSDDHRTVRMMPPVLKRTKKEHQGRAEVVLEVSEWTD